MQDLDTILKLRLLLFLSLVSRDAMTTKPFLLYSVDERRRCYFSLITTVVVCLFVIHWDILVLPDSYLLIMLFQNPNQERPVLF